MSPNHYLPRKQTVGMHNQSFLWSIASAHGRWYHTHCWLLCTLLLATHLLLEVQRLHRPGTQQTSQVGNTMLRLVSPCAHETASMHGLAGQRPRHITCERVAGYACKASSAKSICVVKQNVGVFAQSPEANKLCHYHHCCGKPDRRQDTSCRSIRTAVGCSLLAHVATMTLCSGDSSRV